MGSKGSKATSKAPAAPEIELQVEKDQEDEPVNPNKRISAVTEQYNTSSIAKRQQETPPKIENSLLESSAGMDALRAIEAAMQRETPAEIRAKELAARKQFDKENDTFRGGGFGRKGNGNASSPFWEVDDDWSGGGNGGNGGNGNGGFSDINSNRDTRTGGNNKIKDDPITRVRKMSQFDSEKYRTHNATEQPVSRGREASASIHSNIKSIASGSIIRARGRKSQEGDSSSFDGLLELIDSELETQITYNEQYHHHHHQQQQRQKKKSIIESLDDAIDVEESNTVFTHRKYNDMPPSKWHGNGAPTSSAVASSPTQNQFYSTLDDRGQARGMYQGSETTTTTTRVGGMDVDVPSKARAGGGAQNSGRGGGGVETKREHARGIRGLASPGLASAFFTNDAALSNAMSPSPSHPYAYGSHDNTSASATSGGTRIYRDAGDAGHDRHQTNLRHDASAAGYAQTGGTEFSLPHGVYSHRGKEGKGGEGRGRRGSADHDRERIGGGIVGGGGGTREKHVTNTLDGLDEDLMDLILLDG